MIRCDEQMREKKEAARPSGGHRRWKCKNDCERCICGMKMTHKGVWSHLGRRSDDERGVNF